MKLSRFGAAAFPGTAGVREMAESRLRPRGSGVAAKMTVRLIP